MASKIHTHNRDDDEVVFIEEPPHRTSEKVNLEDGDVAVLHRHPHKHTQTHTADADITIMGSTLTTGADMPHPREVCPRYPFTKLTVVEILTPRNTHNNNNNMYCAYCYCYVCEIKAAECSRWTSHCHASCKLSAWREVKNQVSKDPRSQVDTQVLANMSEDVIAAMQIIANMASQPQSSNPESCIIQ
ncbi:hypothetical protein EON63_18275 [archaeon]|nr:MAG: hypothetical protein EON63_18275 [archaeon]